MEVALSIYGTGFIIWLALAWEIRTSRPNQPLDLYAWRAMIFVALTWPLWFIAGVFYRSDER